MIIPQKAAALIVAVAVVSIAHAQRDGAQLSESRPASDHAQQQERPTSFALIDSALVKRTIDDETAHKYRVFAAFGDSRLPPAYRGDDSRISKMPSAATRVAGLLSTFSPQTRAELEPFFKRPNEAGSWLELSTIEPGAEAAPRRGPNAGSDALDADHHRAIQWYVVSAANGKVKVWSQLRYAGDSLKAEQLARAITNPIWPILTGLFWDPVTDANLPNNGGGPEFDIYLMHSPYPVTPGISWYGALPQAQPGNECVNSPRMMYMDSRYPVGGPRARGMVQGVANLLTDAIVLGRHLRQGNCAEYDWIRQATSVWAEHRVYPDVQTEQDRLPPFLDFPAQSLDVGDNRRNEGAYVLAFYLQLKGAELALPAMWLQFELKKPLDGIDAGLGTVGKKLEDVFPEFAVANWNRKIAGDYWTKDQLSYSAAPADSIVVSIPANAHYEEKLDLGMPYLAAMNYYFNFDPTVKTVTFENTLRPIRHARVWAIEKIKGQWQKPADWSQDGGKTWCRGAPGEELDELVIVFSNVQWQNPNLTVDPGPHQPVLSAYASGCGGWIGQDSVTIMMGDGTQSIVETVVAKLEFEVDSALVRKGMPRRYWKTVGGSITWKATVSAPPCSGSGGATVQIPNSNSNEDHTATLQIYTVGGRLRHSGQNGPWPGQTPYYTVRCPDYDFPMALMGAHGFFVTDEAKDELAPDGKSFSGDHTSGTPPNTTQHVYSFRCRHGC